MTGIGPDEIHLWQTSLNASEETVGHFRNLLSAEELARAERFVKDDTRRSFIVARATLRRLLGRYLNRAPESIVIETGKYGKPEVPGLEFNLSHSDQIVIFAFCATVPVGVDVERVCQIADRDDLVRRFFSADEIAAFEGLAEEERNEAFFNCWTRKEAYIKAIGRGARIPLNSFDVTFEPARDPWIVKINNRDARKEWQLHAFRPAPAHVAALAYRSKVEQTIRSFQASDIAY